MRSHIIRLILLVELLLLASVFFQSEKVSAQFPKVIATHEMSLQTRNHDPFVNQVFKDNILLTLNRLTNPTLTASAINWAVIEKPSLYTFQLQPGETFAFHEDVLPQFQSQTVKTTNSHFNYNEGFKSDGYLMGDGVCHLASLINWAAKDAGLWSYAPTNHDFNSITEIPLEHGVAIYSMPQEHDRNAQQNLYVTNSLPVPVNFIFTYDGTTLHVSVVKG